MSPFCPPTVQPTHQTANNPRPKNIETITVATTFNVTESAPC